MCDAVDMCLSLSVPTATIERMAGLLVLVAPVVLALFAAWMETLESRVLRTDATPAEGANGVIEGDRTEKHEHPGSSNADADNRTEGSSVASDVISDDAGDPPASTDGGPH